jgi:hypothetical protein
MRAHSTQQVDAVRHRPGIGVSFLNPRADRKDKGMQDGRDRRAGRQDRWAEARQAYGVPALRQAAAHGAGGRERRKKGT